MINRIPFAPFALFFAACLVAPVRASEVRVLVEGNINRLELVRVEAAGQQEHVVLHSDSVHETRLPVVEHTVQETFPMTHKITATHGQQSVKVNLTEGQAGAILQASIDRGDGIVKKIDVRSAPRITVHHRGYYNRSSYVRTETIETAGTARQSLVLSTFGTPAEIRLPVTSWLSRETYPVQTEITAKHWSKTVKLFLTEGDSITGSISLDGANPVPLVLLED